MSREQIDALDAGVKRREERRAFFRASGGAIVAAAAGTSLLASCGGGNGNNNNNNNNNNSSSTPPPTTTVTDADILNFALNLEYLEAEFYSYAAFGTPLAANLITGTGTQGAVTGGRQVNFTDPVVAQYAREIAMDERAHVAFLRSALGSAAVAQPAIDVGTDPAGAFSTAARSAGLVGAGQSFDPYSSDENFLLGAFIFEDVGVTAYKGAAPLIASKAFVEASAGLLAAEAYHAGLIRTVLYAKGLAAPSLRTATESISNARDSLDGPADLDQGVAPRGDQSNIVPSDGNGLAFSRSVTQVLNIVFLNALSVNRGGFFPAGLNGTLTTSGSN